MNTSRYSMNWASAALSVAFILTYLFTPFYTLSMLSFSLTGFNLISLQVVAIFPVILGILMAIGACLFPPVAAIIVEALTTVATLIFMFLGNTLAASTLTLGLDLPSEWLAPMSAVLNVTASFRPGWGAIICVGLCIAALVLDILANLATHQEIKPYVINPGDPFGGSDTPFDGGLF